MWGSGQPRWNSPSGAGQQPQPPPMGSWSMDPNHYTQIPHNQVDWATLAQQWIQMKGTEVIELPHGVPIHQNQPDFHHALSHQDVIGEAPMDLDESVGATSTPLYTRSSSSSSPSPVPQQVALPKNTMSPQAHVSHHQHPPWMQTSSFSANENNDLPRRSSNASMQGESLLPQDGIQYGYTSWAQPSLDLGNFNDRGKLYYDAGNMQQERRQSYQEEETYEQDLEAARRKALPPWIREGLEKVEREKRKAEEKEKLAATREEERRLRRKRDHQSDGTEGGLWGDAPTPVSSGIFPSVVSRENDVPEEELSIKLKGSVRQSRPRLPSLQDILTSLTKEEQTEQMMLSVRRQLTKILLEVTDEEMRVVALEALERARAKQKGLGDYGSDSDDQDSDDNDEDVRPPDEDIDSDEELMAEIERKRRNFEMKTLTDEKQEESDQMASDRVGFHEGKTTSRSRSKSGEGTNGKIASVPRPPIAVLPKVASPQPEKVRGKEANVDEKKAERAQSRSPRSRNRPSSSPKPRSSKDKKRSERSKSRDRRNRRSKSGSKKRDRPSHHRRDSSSSSAKDKSSRGRSSSKSRKDKKSSHRRHRSRSSSRTRRQRSRDRRDEKSRRSNRRSTSSSSTPSSPRSNSSRQHRQRH